jgi:hypothetical protein
MTHSPSIRPVPEAPASGGIARAALFAALFQSLRQCPSDGRETLLNSLESSLGSAYDDLSGKLGQILDNPAQPKADQIHGLWMLYLAFIAHPQADAQMWIGPDLFGQDDHECLRLQLPPATGPAMHDLEAQLRIVARTVDERAGVSCGRTEGGQVTVNLHLA